MRRATTVLGLLGALAGCAAPLRYTPVAQPAGVRLAADYRVVGDRLRVEVETGGYRLEQAWIVRPDGARLGPLVVEPGAGRGGTGLGIGVGVGSVGGSGGVSIGTGVGVGTTVGGTPPASTTVAWFPLPEAGPAPWSLEVTVVGIQPTLIVLGP